MSISKAEKRGDKKSPLFCAICALTKASKCAKMARGADIRNAPNLLLYHPAQFLSRVFSHKISSNKILKFVRSDY